MPTQRFPFRFDPMYRVPLMALGITPKTSEVRIDDDVFEAKFGPFRLRTEAANLKDVQITRDYLAVKAIGPRASFADRGATFGTSTVGGVCVCFHKPVPALLGLRHPGLTVTVQDLEGLAAAVEATIASQTSA